jgi:Na+-translocating ferredoxin:NAD+ oxidoreductase RNF subunit RnfB
MTDKFLVSLYTMGGLGLILSIVLALADRRLRVEEDPRVKEIVAVLPSLNCAVCGFANCHVYAEMVTQGKAPVGSCLVGGKAVQAKIAEIMDLQVEKVGEVEAESKIACVHCQGGEKECKRRFRYQGVLTCKAVNLVSGADKACIYGCLGYGDCVRVCPCDALILNEGGLPVVDEQACTGCGLCVKACPRNIISLIPISQQVYLGCVSHDRAKAVRSICNVGCFTCMLCVNPKITPEGLIVMEDNLPTVKAEKIKDWKAIEQAVAKCPAKCYVTRRGG